MSERRAFPTIDEVAIAALLHDIGKFQQRAFGRSEVMPQEIFNRASIVLPVYQGRSSHWHALWSDAFFSNVVDKNPFPKSLDRRWVRDLAVFHHRPPGNYEGGIENGAVTHLITEADRVASGMERKEKDVEGDAEPGGLGRDKYRKTQLDSMFSQIELFKDKPKPTQLRQKLAELKSDTLVPEEGDSIDPLMPHAFARLWPEFVKSYMAMAKSAGDDVPSFIDGLLSLSERFTWAIPSSTMDQPDISLYDHSRAVAAVAVCLFRHHEHAGSLNDAPKIADKDALKFQFVLGDLSGIQTALFRLASEGVSGLAKVLRGRSLRFSLIADAFARMALDTLGLPACCVLQNAGGRFLILAPVTEADRQTADLDALRGDVDQWMRAQYSGELAFNIARTPAFSGRDLQDQANFKKLLAKVGVAAEEAKLRPLAGARAPLGEQSDKALGICATCGVRQGVHEDEDGKVRCVACDAETKIGKAYVKAQAIVLDRRGIYNRVDCIGDINIGLPNEPFPERPSRGFRFFGVADHANYPAATRFAGAYVPRHTAKTLANLEMKQARKNSGDLEAAKEGDLLTFAELAAHSVKDGKGRAMLAVLKADVDRLGQIFTRGFSERCSLARTAALSRMMDAFFTGYLAHLLEKQYPFIYTVFAGGDDVLLLGPWHDILLLAQTLREEFANFTGHSQHVTLSCGIALFAPKTPVSIAAHEAEERLSRAKRDGRDRIHLITDAEDSSALTWVNYLNALDMSESLHKWLNDSASGVTTALLYKLLWFDDRRLQAEAGLAAAHDWVGKLGYYLHRSLGGKKHEAVRLQMLTLMGLSPDLKRFDAITAPSARTALSIAIYRNR